MTDVQVSNARRIGFTALALVAFWVDSFSGYSAGCEHFSEGGVYIWSHGITYEVLHRANGIEVILIALSLALLPTALFYLSVHIQLLRNPERSVLLAGLSFVCVSGFCYWLGGHDARAAFDIHTADMPNPTTTPGFTARHVAARQTHTVSWLWLLPPIILTTAFVIFASWRQAVRDAAVEAVGEDAEE